MHPSERRFNAWRAFNMRSMRAWHPSLEEHTTVSTQYMIYT
jgi:hypothetical protein